MNNAIDQDLEQLTDGIYTPKPHDELESVLLFREKEVDEALDDLFEGLTA